MNGLVINTHDIESCHMTTKKMRCFNADNENYL